MKRAITGAITLVGLVLVICSVMGVVLLGSNGTWHSELKVPAGRTAVVVEPALASVLGPRITVRAEADEPGRPAACRCSSGGPGRTTPSALLEIVGPLLVGPGWTARARLSTGTARQRPLAGPGHRGRLAVPGDRRRAPSRSTYRARPGAESVVIARADGKPLPALTLRLGWTRARLVLGARRAAAGRSGRCCCWRRRLRAPTSRGASRWPWPPRPQPQPERRPHGPRGANQHVGRRRATPANGRRR